MAKGAWGVKASRFSFLPTVDLTKTSPVGDRQMMPMQLGTGLKGHFHLGLNSSLISWWDLLMNCLV